MKKSHVQLPIVFPELEIKDKDKLYFEDFPNRIKSIDELKVGDIIKKNTHKDFKRWYDKRHYTIIEISPDEIKYECNGYMYSQNIQNLFEFGIIEKVNIK